MSKRMIGKAAASVIVCTLTAITGVTMMVFFGSMNEK